jgi:recombination associated protein RdgC
MWFKNCYVFDLDSSFEWDLDALKQGLDEFSFKEIGKYEQHKLGWVTPYVGEHDQLVHFNGKSAIIALRRDEKVIPPATVNQKINERKQEIESREVRKVFRKEERRLKEEVIESLLPHAMFSSRVTLLYIDIERKVLVIDCSSQRRAQEVTEFLRKSIGSLPITPMHKDTDVSIYMKKWLTDEAPLMCQIGDECELKALDEGGSIKIKGHDVTHDDFINLMDDRVMVTKLALCWNESIEFIMTDDGSIRRIKFSDGIKEEAEFYDKEDYIGQFDSDFTIMTLQMGMFIDAIKQWIPTNSQ